MEAETFLRLKLFGFSSLSHLNSCQLQKSVELMEPESVGFGFKLTNLHLVILELLKDLLLEGGSIVLAFVAIGCMGLFMLYIVNGIYVISYILIQLIVGDGNSLKSPEENKNLIYQLIFDQILLYRYWKKPNQDASSSSSNLKRPNNLWNTQNHSFNTRTNAQINHVRKPLAIPEISRMRRTPTISFSQFNSR